MALVACQVATSNITYIINIRVLFFCIHFSYFPYKFWETLAASPLLQAALERQSDRKVCVRDSVTASVARQPAALCESLTKQHQVRNFLVVLWWFNYEKHLVAKVPESHQSSAWMISLFELPKDRDVTQACNRHVMYDIVFSIFVSLIWVMSRLRTYKATTKRQVWSATMTLW